MLLRCKICYKHGQILSILIFCFAKNKIEPNFKNDKNTKYFNNNEPFDKYVLCLYKNKCFLTHLTFKQFDGLGFILPFLYDYIYILIHYINLILIYIYMNLFVEKKKNVKILKHLLTV